MGNNNNSSTEEVTNVEQNNSKGAQVFPTNKDICYNDAGIISQLYESFYSRPLDKINLPEVRELLVDFQYNYYTIDERVRPDVPDTKTLVNLDIDNSDELFYRISTEKKPRFIKISFKKPKVYNNVIKVDPLINRYEGVNID